ncbi:sigma factor-like helix-turn-helix DNA-binding protein [Rhodospirillaceae bacterium SYSU D60014]|uniref:sigma factor-like helix-turn-helix DNA-binding protein n=1 Tax=Virgifigura deserti TaxID=2268457 RepID=UPI0013C4E5F7
MTISELEAIEQFVPHLRRFARALLHDADQADGLVRDCLSEAVLRRQQRESAANLRIWLFTILHDRYAREFLRPGDEAAGLSAGRQSFGGASGGVRSPSATGFTVRDFENAFRQLSAEDQQILLLIGLEGMSHQEAAEVLGLPLGTFMLRLWQIKKRLRSVERKTNGLQRQPVRPSQRSHILKQRSGPNGEPHQGTAAIVRFGRS